MRRFPRKPRHGINRIRGTAKNDVLTGSKKRDFIAGFRGDDIIDGGEGKDRAWGGKGNDVFVTVDGGKGYLVIHDFKRGNNVIEFCGCPSTQLVQKGDNVRIVKDDDIKAVVRGVTKDELEIDFINRVITLISYPAPDSFPY